MTFSATWIFATGKPFTEPVGAYTLETPNSGKINFLVVDKKNNARYPNYHRMDLLAKYDMSFIKAFMSSISVSLFNINNTELTETSSGTYTLSLEDGSLGEGETYNLKFDYNGKRIEASTTIPSPFRSLTVEPQSLELSSYYWNFSDTTQVVVSWDDPGNSFYQVYIESPDNPDIPAMGMFRQRIMQPFQGNSYKISTREFRSTGNHTIYVYRVCNDYAELYERISASDLANPVSYIQNAFGIFTSMSMGEVTVRVYEASE